MRLSSSSPTRAQLGVPVGTERDRDRESQRERERDTQRERQRETERQRQRETDREREAGIPSAANIAATSCFSFALAFLSFLLGILPAARISRRLLQRATERQRGREQRQKDTHTHTHTHTHTSGGT